MGISQKSDIGLIFYKNFTYILHKV